MNYYVYNKDTGKLMVRCSYEPSPADLDTRNESFIESDDIIDLLKYKVEEGSFVELAKTQDELDAEKEQQQMAEVYHEMFQEAYRKLKEKDPTASDDMLLNTHVDSSYEKDKLIAWAMQQSFASDIMVHMAAFIDFANKATETSKDNFFAYAGSVGLITVANTIINKAVELGADLEEV